MGWDALAKLSVEMGYTSSELRIWVAVHLMSHLLVLLIRFWGRGVSCDVDCKIGDWENNGDSNPYGYQKVVAVVRGGVCTWISLK